MRNKISIISLFIGAVTLSSCGKDRSNEIVIAQETQQWIYSTMEKNYFWNDEIPDKDKLDFFAAPASFFNKLLSQKDGKQRQGQDAYHYSYIVNTDDDIKSQSRSLSQPEYSYGFEFRGVITNIETENQILAQVYYTIPNTAASKAGLKRGDLIKSINKENLSVRTLSNLLGGEAITIEYYRLSDDSKSVRLFEVELDGAGLVDNNPIFKYKKINANTGYLMYNHFTASKNKDDKAYDNQLKELALELKGVEDFILDLRYNNGGLVTSAELLYAILSPEDQAKTSPGYLLYNDGKKSSMGTPEKTLGGSASNLNIKRLFVLTSTATASASELIINSIRPFTEVHIIGEATEGKNVGSLTYTKGNWELHPIVCKIYNSLDQTDYDEGFNPGIYRNNSFYKRTDYNVPESLYLGELGKGSDPLMATVFKQLAISKTRALTEPTAISLKEFKPLSSSIDKRRKSELILTDQPN